MSCRIKIVTGFSSEKALVILQSGVWHVVAQGTEAQMTHEKNQYIKDYPFLDTLVNLESDQIFTDLSKRLKPGVFHKVSKGAGAASFFRTFN